MVKAVKSMFNLDNASWIFIGAVVIILIILAVFYFSRSKNVESFAEDWETEFKKGAKEQSECGDQKEFAYAPLKKYNNTGFCLPRCFSDEDCPEIPNNNGELERIKCQEGNPDKRILGICYGHPKLSDRPKVIASGCASDNHCAKDERCKSVETTDKPPEQWGGECIPEDREICKSVQDCGEDSVCNFNIFLNANEGTCSKLCINDNDCEAENQGCDGANPEKHIKGVCQDMNVVNWNNARKLPPRNKCFYGYNPAKNTCSDGYKCMNGVCMESGKPEGSDGGDEGDKGENSDEGDKGEQGDEGFSNYYEYFSNKKSSKKSTTPAPKKSTTPVPKKSTKPVKKSVIESTLEARMPQIPSLMLKEKFYGGYYY